MDSRKWWTPPEIAKALKVSREKVLGWIRSQKLQATNVSNGHQPRWRVRDDDLVNFLAARRATPLPRSRVITESSPYAVAV
jgi:excisionase family DNA binding protein